MKKDYSEKTMGVLARLGIEESNSGVSTGNNWFNTKGDTTVSVSPIDGKPIASVVNGSAEDLETVIQTAEKAFQEWKTIPAPQRGEVVRQIGLALRDNKEDLGYLVSLEMGKIYQEGLGEVQEMIDICDFAVGLSRQLHGLTIASERPQHRLTETWQPLGPVGAGRRIPAPFFPGWRSGSRSERPDRSDRRG